MFNFLKKLAGGPAKEESCGKPACGSTMPKSSCSTEKPKAAMGSCGSGVKPAAGGCGHDHDDDHTAPRGTCH